MSYQFVTILTFVQISLRGTFINNKLIRIWNFFQKPYDILALFLT